MHKVTEKSPLEETEFHKGNCTCPGKGLVEPGAAICWVDWSDHLFWDRPLCSSLWLTWKLWCRPGSTQTHREICLPPPPSGVAKGVYHHTWLGLVFQLLALQVTWSNKPDRSAQGKVGTPRTVFSAQHKTGNYGSLGGGRREVIAQCRLWDTESLSVEPQPGLVIHAGWDKWQGNRNWSWFGPQDPWSFSNCSSENTQREKPAHCMWKMVWVPINNHSHVSRWASNNYKIE